MRKAGLEIWKKQSDPPGLEPRGPHARQVLPCWAAALAAPWLSAAPLADLGVLGAPERVEGNGWVCQPRVLAQGSPHTEPRHLCRRESGSTAPSTSVKRRQCQLYPGAQGSADLSLPQGLLRGLRAGRDRKPLRSRCPGRRGARLLGGPEPHHSTRNLPGPAARALQPTPARAEVIPLPPAHAGTSHPPGPGHHCEYAPVNH